MIGRLGFDEEVQPVAGYGGTPGSNRRGSHRNRRIVEQYLGRSPAEF